MSTEPVHTCSFQEVGANSSRNSKCCGPAQVHHEGARPPPKKRKKTDSDASSSTDSDNT